MFDEIALKLGSQSEFKTIFNELDEAIFIFEDKKLQNMNILFRKFLFKYFNEE